MSDLSDHDVAFRIQAMTLSAHITQTAIALAEAAGETIDRPLTDAQLKRAFEIHIAEDHLLTVMLIDYAEYMHLPEWKRPPRP